MAAVQRAGFQGWRPGSMIEAWQGPPYGQNWLSALLSIPQPQSSLQEDLDVQANVDINWWSFTFNNSLVDNVVQAQPNRVVLVVQNQSSSYPIAVNFGTAASITGTSPNQVSQGIMLLPGVTLWIDRLCPTNTVHIYSAAGGATVSPVLVMQGLSALGNAPDLTVIELLETLVELQAAR